jgi:hypothetical protein
MCRRIEFRGAAAAIMGAVAILVSMAAPIAADESSAASPAPKAPASGPAAEGATYRLRYKCALGDVWRYEASHQAAIRSTIEQTTQTAQTKTDSVKSWKITDILPDGAIEFLIVVEKVRMVNKLPDKDPTEYDSVRDQTPPPGFEDAARNVGVPLSVVRMTPQGKVLRRELRIKRPGSDDDSPLIVLLPEKPVAVGETWDESFELTVTLKTGGSKRIHTRRHYTLAKVESGLATIEVDYQVLSPIDAHIESQLVQRLMDGEVQFDIEAGQVIGQKMDIDKTILGFAGPASSMNYVMRLEEKLLVAPAKVIAKPAEAPNGASAGSARRSAAAPRASKAITPRAATRRRGTQSASGDRR